jgi:hypothetical protein
MSHRRTAIHSLGFAAAVVGALLGSSAQAGNVDVGVSVQISQPGVYGRIDIGRFPQPQVVVAQPVVIQRPAKVAAAPQPVYLWVPPGHRKNWSKHCGRYNACGVPVYFVRDDWYDQNVQKGASEKHRGKGHGKGHKDD